jgi:hypothetical protein
MAAALPGPDLSGLLDGAAEEQQLLGDGGLAGIGVADDGEGTATIYFILIKLLHYSYSFDNRKAGRARLDPAYFLLFSRKGHQERKVKYDEYCTSNGSADSCRGYIEVLGAAL